jgi:hypothetical protein
VGGPNLWSASDWARFGQLYRAGFLPVAVQAAVVFLALMLVAGLILVTLRRWWFLPSGWMMPAAQVREAWGGLPKETRRAWAAEELGDPIASMTPDAKFNLVERLLPEYRTHQEMVERLSTEEERRVIVGAELAVRMGERRENKVQQDLQRQARMLGGIRLSADEFVLVADLRETVKAGASIELLVARITEPLRFALRRSKDPLDAAVVEQLAPFLSEDGKHFLKPFAALPHVDLQAPPVRTVENPNFAPVGGRVDPPSGFGTAVPAPWGPGPAAEDKSPAARAAEAFSRPVPPPAAAPEPVEPEPVLYEDEGPQRVADVPALYGFVCAYDLWKQARGGEFSSQAGRTAADAFVGMLKARDNVGPEVLVEKDTLNDWAYFNSRWVNVDTVVGKIRELWDFVDEKQVPQIVAADAFSRIEAYGETWRHDLASYAGTLGDEAVDAVIQKIEQIDNALIAALIEA